MTCHVCINLIHTLRLGFNVNFIHVLNRFCAQTSSFSSGGQTEEQKAVSCSAFVSSSGKNINWSHNLRSKYGADSRVVLRVVALCSMAVGCQPFGVTDCYQLPMTDRVGGYEASKEYTASIFTFIWWRKVRSADTFVPTQQTTRLHGITIHQATTWLSWSLNAKS